MSAQAERRHMEERLEKIDMRSVFRAARRMAGRKYRGQPNWAFAADLLALGSTYACGFCRKHGIDPDATTVERADA